MQQELFPCRQTQALQRRNYTDGVVWKRVMDYDSGEAETFAGGRTQDVAKGLVCPEENGTGRRCHWSGWKGGVLAGVAPKDGEIIGRRSEKGRGGGLGGRAETQKVGVGWSCREKEGWALDIPNAALAPTWRGTQPRSAGNEVGG